MICYCYYYYYASFIMSFYNALAMFLGNKLEEGSSSKKKLEEGSAKCGLESCYNCDKLRE